MNVPYPLTTVTKILTAPTLMALFCVLAIVDMGETELFAKVIKYMAPKQDKIPAI
jgi:hypothetical protein